MKTFYGLLLIISILAMSAILIMPVLFIWKVNLILLVLGLAWREFKRFSVQSLSFFNNKILITDHHQTYETDYLPSSVVARHLCFLHLQIPGGEKRWWIPVSRLEFSKDTFRQLKCALQRHNLSSL